MKFSETILTKTLRSVLPVLSYNLHSFLLSGICNLATIKAVSGSSKDKMIRASTGGLPQEGISLVSSHKITFKKKKKEWGKIHSILSSTSISV